MIPYKKINLSIQRRYKNQGQIKPILGWDTETKDGYVKVLANNYNYFKVEDFKDIIILMTNRRYENHINVFYNLSFDFMCIFKHNLSLLYQFSKDQPVVKWGKHKFYYIPGKYFKIQKGNHVWHYYDIAQFFNTSLEIASKKYLDLNKPEFKEYHQIPHAELKRNREILFLCYKPTTIGKYCRVDAKLTKGLGEYFIEKLYKLGIYPSKLVSNGNIAGLYLLNKGHIPLIQYLPDIVQEFYYKAFRGGWFELHKRGTFDKSCGYDIISAYPHALSQLPDIRDGVWIRGIDEDSECGVLKVKLLKSVVDLLPISFNIKHFRYYPSIHKPITTYITLREYKVLRDYYDIDIIDGYTFIEKKRHRHPFFVPVQQLYKVKQSHKKDLGLYSTSKQIINSFYGKCLEKRKDGHKWVTGNFYNPFYGAECTSIVRNMIFNTFKDHVKDIIMIATDGVHTTKKVKIETGSNLGDWERDFKNEVVTYVLSGVYQPHRFKPKTRGFSNVKDLIGLLDTDKPEVKIKKVKPIQFKEAFIQNRTEDIGVFLPYERTIGVNSEIKRLWVEKPQTLRDLLHNNYNSVALPNSVC